MLNKNVKLLIIILLVATAIWQFTENNIGNGIFLILLSLIVLLFYFKNEIIIMALLRLRKQDFPGAHRWLAKIKNPEAVLVVKQQGYYYFLMGLMEMQTNLNEAEKKFKKAIQLGITKEDLALTKLNLAGIAMSKRRKVEATQLLNEAKKLDPKNLLKEQINQMKDRLKRM